MASWRLPHIGYKVKHKFLHFMCVCVNPSDYSNPSHCPATLPPLHYIQCGVQHSTDREIGGWDFIHLSPHFSTSSPSSSFSPKTAYGHENKLCSSNIAIEKFLLTGPICLQKYIKPIQALNFQTWVFFRRLVFSSTNIFSWQFSTTFKILLLGLCEVIMP